MDRIESGDTSNPLANSLLWAAVPVPCTASGEIATDAQNAYARWFFSHKADGVVVWAHTGRGLHWNENQRGSIIETWHKNRTPGKFVIAAAGAPPSAKSFIDALAAARAMAQQAESLGADAIMIHPPCFLRGDDQIWQKCFAFHQAVLESVRIPGVLFYLYEKAGGLSYPMDLLDDLLTLPQVMGIKVATLDSVMTFQDIAGLMKLHTDKKLITGEDRFLGYSLMAGAQSALIGMASAFVSPQADLIKSWHSQDLPRFMKLSQIVDAFSFTTFRQPMEGYIARMLACLVHEGVIESTSAHDPFGPSLEAGEFQKIGTILKVLQRRYAAIMHGGLD
ncbi:MAG: dihydrodipicolinate synthase family protein [bacterium]